MAPFLIPAALTLAGGLASRFLAPKLERGPRIDFAALRSEISAGINTGTAQRISGVKQAGAARRLPAGATQTAIAEAGIEGEAARGRALADIERLKLPTAQQDFQFSQARRAGFDDTVNFALEGASTIAALAGLNKAGLFGEGGQKKKKQLSFADSFRVAG